MAGRWKALSATPRAPKASGPRLRSSGLRRDSEGVRVLEIREAGKPAEEGQVDAPDRAVALLADDHLGAPLRLLLVGRVDLIAVDEEDQVGILLDGARLAQV